MCQLNFKLASLTKVAFVISATPEEVLIVKFVNKIVFADAS